MISLYHEITNGRLLGLCFRSSVTFAFYHMWKSIGIVTDSSEYKGVSVAKEEDWKA